MPAARTGVIDLFRSITMTMFGIILSLIPPALWFAWTETMLLVVVAIGVVSAGALVALADSEPEDRENPQAAASVAKRRILADRSIVEIHRIFPLTYHHSLVDKTRFRQAMDKVRQLLK
jgi:hypothetical protein